MKPLAKKIDNYIMRTFETPHFATVEYSKTPTHSKFYSGSSDNIQHLISSNNLFFEVFDRSLEKAKDGMRKYLFLTDQINNDFNGKFIEKIDLDGTFNDGEKAVPVKITSGFGIVDFSTNIRSVAIIYLGRDEEDEIEMITLSIDQLLSFDVTRNFEAKGNGLDSSKLVFNKKVYIYQYGLKTSKLDILISRLESKGMVIELRDKEYREKMKPSFFICHDSRDKAKVAKPLFESLKSLGCEVWYDEYSLEIGDSLTESIQKGIIEMDYGIVILSKDFLLNERWVQYELKSLLTKEVSSAEKTILPIWHDINESDLKDTSYYLIDKIGLNTNEEIINIAVKLSKLKKKNQ
jgi:uncharacterized protein YqgQ